MTLKAVIWDLDGTTIDATGKAVAGVADTMKHLAKLGVANAVATNYPKARASKLLRENKLPVTVISAPDTAGARKPSAQICKYVAGELRIDLNEMIYVGDSDDTDALAAMNARVLYLGARWAKADLKYGVPVAEPNSLLRFARRFLLGQPKWYWTLDRSDSDERRVEVKLLLPATKSSHDLKAVLKFDQNPMSGRVRLREFLLRRLLTSIYMEGIASNLKLWTWYPGAAGQQKGEKFGEFLDQASKIFHGFYAPELLIRHKPAVKSAKARSFGSDPGFINQVNTVVLNSDYRKKIQGNEILVVDDFCTEGYSFECARNLLLTAGASRVHCVGFGRYHDSYQIQTPTFKGKWDPFTPRSFADDDFASETVYGQRDEDALGEMKRLVQLSL